jgi:hypothetical protein
LNGITEEMAEGIEEGKIGAFSTEDEKTSGYYIVEWTSEHTHCKKTHHLQSLIHHFSFKQMNLSLMQHI